MVDEKRIYAVATAHLDTVWNWDFEHTVSECIFNTLADNFRLFEEYPKYKFSFEGAYRYELIEEYYPELFEQLREYIKEGRWNVAGSSYENGDVNIPSPETLFRNILYGNEYFDKKFGKRSRDIYLPDCFGFGWALPSIAEHSNLLGFTTQKLRWGSAKGIPFDLGRWYGPDGKWIFANLDAGNYSHTPKKVRNRPSVKRKLRRNENEGRLPWTLSLYGTGDVGGAPKEEGVKAVLGEVSENRDAKVKVLSSGSDEIFSDLNMLDSDNTSRLPEFRDELLMTKHGTGSYTSRAFSKRMNRKNEELADMAEKSAVISSYLTGTPYPKEEIDKAWKRVIAHTFHDDITGTSLQRVYLRSWNDLVLSANQFSNIYEGGSQQIIKNLDTSWVEGTAVVVNNSLEQKRSGAVEVMLYGEGIEFVRVFDKHGDECICQLSEKTDTRAKVVFIATVPAMGYKVFDIRLSDEKSEVTSGIRVSDTTLENEKYFVQLNDSGDIASIIDKTLANKELLNKPIGYHVMRSMGGRFYPAWEIRYSDIKGIPWEYAGGGETEVIERGPARVTLKCRQKTDHAEYTYYVSLTAGGEYVEVQNEIDWSTTRAVLKNRFSFTASNRTATFDLGLGAIKRGNRTKKLYEVPAQKWADISDKKHSYGVSVFSDSKYGWDKPDNNTLRLTVLHTPKRNFKKDSMQSMMDLGINRYGYAIYSHHGTFENGTQFCARCFNQPMGVFVTDNHPGILTGEYSFGEISDENVIIRAIKKAENSDDIIIRVNEGSGKAANNVRISLGEGIMSAVEMYASEEYLGEAEVVENRLIFDLKPFEVKTFSVKLIDKKVSSKAHQKTVELPFNVDVITYNDSKETTIIPTLGISLPGELVPERITCGGVNFETAKVFETMNNALICNGQEIETDADYLSIVAASLVGDKGFIFTVDDKEYIIPIQAIEERIGCWDLPSLGQAAFIKKDKVAWECTHTHSEDGDNVANQLFFFRYDIPVKGASRVVLPEDNEVIILAATEVADTADTVLISDLYDSIDQREIKLRLSDFQKSQQEKQLRKVMSGAEYRARKAEIREEEREKKLAEKERRIIEEHERREEAENLNVAQPTRKQKKKVKKQLKAEKKLSKKQAKAEKKFSKNRKTVEEDIRVDEASGK